MKVINLVLGASLLLAACNNANNSTTGAEASAAAPADATPVATAASSAENAASIQWLDSTHQNLGRVNEGQVVEITWRFKNTGSKPLVISNVSASCGCTVPDKPQQPIAPGGEEIIRARFDSKDRVGPQQKDVYVETSGGNSTQLSFALEVVKQ